MHPVLKVLRGTIPWFQERRSQLFAMLRELGIPAFFVTISANEVGWADLILECLMQEVRSLDFHLSEAQVNQLAVTVYNQIRTDKTAKQLLLRRHPVAVCQHFDRRVKAFLAAVQKDQSFLGPVHDFWFRYPPPPIRAHHLYNIGLGLGAFHSK